MRIERMEYRKSFEENVTQLQILLAFSTFLVVNYLELEDVLEFCLQVGFYY